MKQFASANPNQCAVMCAADKMCVSFSHHEEQCFLHSRFCDVNSLPSAEGSSYAGKCLSVCNVYVDLWVMQIIHFGITQKRISDQ